ncbi:MAG: class B sortase [Butyrivibrio sp.]|uniref:class B sortase n=1 Tax=Butyrivibrio sp. TaxID=28121 RepID=UPI001AFFA830|nr:class B sortase [Butyrivibrio sp.]MBO6240162.1 class B sortase [Butyrivibrio sp.]
MAKKIIRIAAIIICFIIIIYEGIMIYIDQNEYKEASDEYDEIRSIAVTYTPEDEAEIVDYPLLSINFNKLEEINPDITAWVYFPCLDISYPVVKESEIDEYLYKTFDLQDNKAGCIFEDVLSDPEFKGYHDIIFGHNMKDKSMFGKLKTLYQPGNETLLEEDPYVYIYTRDYVYQYKVFAYYITTVGSEAYTVVSDLDGYKDFISFIQTHSAYKIPTDVDLDSGNSILTLSTCSGKTGGKQRFVVHSLKVNGWEK